MSAVAWDEYYGEVTVDELAAIRKYGVSQADHQLLAHLHGRNHQAIAEAIVRCSPTGNYQWQPPWGNAGEVW